MENKRALPRLFGAEFKRSLTVRFLLVPVGVVLCICLDTWNQIPFMWTSPETMDVYYYWCNSFIFGGFYGIYVVPMLATLPYAVSFCEEYNTNMLRVLLMKAGKKKYCMSKVLTTFLSGALSVSAGGITFIFLANFFVQLFNRARLPETEAFPYYEFLLQGNVACYFTAVIFLLFLNGGLWATVALLVSSYFPNIYVTAASPLILSFLTGRAYLVLKIPVRLRLDLWLQGRSSAGTDQLTILCSALVVLGLTVGFGILFYQKLKRRVENE